MYRMPTVFTIFPCKLLRQVECGLPSGCPAVRVYLVFVACALTAAFCGGCGDRGLPERVVVSGTVTFNGKPVPEGLIRFVPGPTSMVPVTGARIKDGAYKADKKGGVPIGTHKIEIEALRSVDPNPSQPADTNVLHSSEMWLRQYIPAKYNRLSQLEITIESGSGKIIKNLELAD